MFKVGVYQVDITPPCGLPHGCWALRSGLANGVHDPLLATAVVFDDGMRQLALVAVDLVTVDREFCRDVRTRIEALTGIPSTSILINAAHNHSAPGSLFSRRSDSDARSARSPRGYESYEGTVRQDVAGCVYAAQARLEPARLGFSSVSVPGVSVNRIRPGDSVDASLRMLWLETTDGRLLGVVARFSCHPISIGGQTLLWNADFVGPLRDTVQRGLPGAMFMFLQGCSGDVAPWDYWFGNEAARLHTYEARDELGRSIGQAALNARPSEYCREVELASASRVLKMKRRPLAWTSEEITALMKQAELELPSTLPPVWPDELHTTMSAQRGPAHYRFARLRLYAEMKRAKDDPIPAEIQVLRVGPVAIAGAPFDLFNQVGTTIAEQSPFALTLVVGHTNGAEGYLPTTTDVDRLAPDLPLEEILDENKYRTSYGTTTTSAARGEVDRLVAETVRMLTELAPQAKRSEVQPSDSGAV